MPKKTKQEKIIAEYRRKFQYTYAQPIPLSPPTQKSQTVDTSEFTQIRRDLVKTLVLAAIAIAIEFIFYRLS